MSFSSRHSPRFSYTSGTSPTPTELIGQTTFWQDRNPNKKMVERYSRKQSFDTPHFVPVGVLSADEKNLITVLGVGLIVAILIDAVSHSGSR